MLLALRAAPVICHLCATDTTGKDITNIQTVSPSALCDFPAHSLRAFSAASLWGQTG